MAGWENFDLKYWDPQVMLDLYIYDYLVKNNRHESAALFAQEANIDTRYGVAINTSEGFLLEWWSFFWDMYCARAQINNRDIPESSSMGERRMGNELELMHAQPEMIPQRAGQSSFSTDIAMLRQPAGPMVPPTESLSNMQFRGYEPQAHMIAATSNASHQQMQVYNPLQQQGAGVDGRASGGSVYLPMVPTSYGTINLGPAHLNEGLFRIWKRFFEYGM